MKNRFSKFWSESTPAVRSMILVALIGAPGATLAATTYLYFARATGSWQLYVWGALNYVLAINLIIGAILASRKSVVQGAWLVILTGIIAFTVPAAFISGSGLVLGVTLALLASLVALQTLPPVTARWATYIGLISGATAVLLELFSPFPKIAEPGLVSILLPSILGFVILVYGILTARQFNSYALRTKLIFLFISITAIPLILSGYLSYTRERDLAYQNATQGLAQLSNALAAQVDTFITNGEASIAVDSKNPLFIEYLSTPPLNLAGNPDADLANANIQSLTQRDLVYIRSYALLNSNGSIVLDSNTSDLGKSESGYGYFKATLQNNGPTFSGPYFNQNGGAASLFFSAIVRNQNSQPIGMLRVEYDARVIESIAEKLIPANNPDLVFLRIIDQKNFVRIAHTGNASLLYKSYKDFSPSEMKALQDQSLLLPGLVSDAVSAEPDTVAGIQSLSQSKFFTSFSKTLGANTVNTGTQLTSAPWLAFARQSETTIYTPVNNQFRTVVLLSILLIVLAALAGLGASQILAAPLLNLASTAEQIATGDLNKSASVVTQDEVGTLAESFNRMTYQLKSLLSGLETKVAERTSELELQRNLSNRRAEELQAIGEIANTISTEQNIDVLLPLITRIVSDKMGYYHVGIFLVDESRQFAVLQAANSEGGRRMLERGHRLEVGQVGLVGYVAQQGEPRLALDVGEDAVFFNNPDLPNTRSEIALPLNARSNTIGVLDVQSTESGAFSEMDANILSILGEQIAIAIENARLFNQTQQAFKELQTLYRQNLREGWQTFIQLSGQHVGYYQTLAGGKLLEKPVDSEEIQKALKHGDVVVLDNENTKSGRLMVLPLKLRGEILGVLKITSPMKDRHWNKDEIKMVQTISDRLSLALDNARLIQDSQRRAVKEQVIGEVTSKISQSINLRNVLQTAVEELGHVLPGSDVIIQFESENGKAKDQD